ncbi:MAG TPA: beta-ketoacyl synthase N-terminal-like domain-containing protein [Silvibacterium sp.]|nr:beta-ketoacyl synthase N-terminal-like domain-containing protein [Silvibacterium sp.]
MAHDDNSGQTVAQNAEELSPVKRALVEIRRLRAELESCRRGQLEPVAIIGLAVRLPGGITSPERFWKALAEGKDLITTVPPERWDAQAYWSPDADQPGTMYDIHGGFLADIDAFDAELFGIHAREAASMDPQHRILLEMTWEALERATIDPRSLKNSQTGIYLGLTNSDYGRLLVDAPRAIDGYTGVGAAASIAAGRLAYFLGTHGPALAIDTACSSSLVAVHQAVQSLRRGEIDLAIVGAANLILSPEMNVSFSRTRMLSRDGRCKTFDASADGYVRAEGCCAVVLKRLADAVRDDDRVLAKIVGTAVNQDGRSAGITAPNGPAQEAVMRAALADAGLLPGEISYVEAHGTGTPLGDPMEVQAIGAVYGGGRTPESLLRIGSVKTNLGHTEAAAGLAGLIKVALMMQPDHGIAPHLHLRQPSPQIDWSRWAIEVPVQLTAWSNEGPSRYAGVSSFGFSGTNAHLIVGSAEETAALRAVRDEATEQKESLLCLSAANKAALRALAHQYVDHLRQTEDDFRDICFTAVVGRAKLTHRLGIIACTAAAAAEMLETWLSGGAVEGLRTSADTLWAAQPGGRDDELKKLQQKFVEGGDIRLVELFRQTPRRRVELPLYPFQRQRHWFGDPPLVRQQKERAEAWRSARAAAEQQSAQGPLGWDLDHYPERWKALEKLTRAHAQNVLAAVGAFPDAHPASADDVLQLCGIQPIYLKLVGRWLSGLAQDGSLIQTGDKFRATDSFQPVSLDPLWQDAARWMEDDPGALAYLKQCGALLGEVLTGRKGALETLFPDGSFVLAEGLYRTSAQAHYVNPIVAVALSAAAQVPEKRRTVRILELGGGTGGTTSAILPLLPPGRVEYWFTDLSELFLSRARRDFSQYGFVHYRLFDIDREFEQQGFRGGMFDVVVAANVVHAARNLGAALGRIQRLLSTGGILVLLETTHHHSWFDMSTGLIEGWQHFEDEDRQEHPLLTPDRWRAALERTGFDEVIALPSADSPASALGQHVLMARRREDAEAHAQSEMPAVNLKQTTLIRPAQPLNGALKEEFRGVPSEMREPMVATAVRETVCSVLRLDTPPEELSDRDRLTDLGMDSLIALELRSELGKRLGLEEKISSTIAFDTGTVGELTRSLMAMLAREADGPLGISDIRPKQRRRPEPALLTEEKLQSMSEEEVELLLKERLAKQ